MNSRLEIPGAMRSYLLGQLADDDRPEVEERLLTDDGAFEELLMLEDELIDEYLEGRLNGAERVQFEQHFLITPERQQKLGFARTLNRFANTSPGQSAPSTNSWFASFNTQTWLRAVAVIAVIAILAGAFWMMRSRGPVTFATLNLNAVDSNRAEGVDAQKVVLPLSADALKITLRLPSGFGPVVRYHVEMLKNAEVIPLEIAAQDQQSVSVVIVSSKLERGQYALKLYAIRADGAEQPVPGSYFFTVD